MPLLRVAEMQEARKTVTAGAAFRPFPGSNPPAAGDAHTLANMGCFCILVPMGMCPLACHLLQ